MIGQGNHHVELSRVLSQSLATHFHVSELALDASEGLLHLGPNTVLDVFNLNEQRVHRAVLVQCVELARAHVQFPGDIQAFGLTALGHDVNPFIGPVLMRLDGRDHAAPPG